MARRESLSTGEARRAVLAAQGFGRAPASGAVGRRQLVGTVRRLGLVQVDSVHAVTRAHYVPLFSRLGAYDRALLDRAGAEAPRALFEYWGHEASLLPVETQPLLRWRMDLEHQWSGVAAHSAEEHALRAEILAAVTELGPITAPELERHLEHDHPVDRSDWGWNWSAVKRLLESLFWSGEVASAGRDGGFRRRYAAPEAVLPTHVLATPTPPRSEAVTRLVAIAGRALGIATAGDLRDYFRLSAADTRTAIEALVAAGELLPVTVPGWPQAWRHADAVVPRSVRTTALLVPFDPLIWFRERVQRVFGMRYRIEIYVPEAKREFGYYVFPLLLGDRLAARVDLRADRKAGVLRVLAAWRHAAADVPDDEVIPALAVELRRLAGWLALEDVAVQRRGDLAAGLARHVAA